MKRFVNKRLSRKSIQELVYEYLHFENGFELSANAFLKDARKPVPNSVLQMDENVRTLTNILNDHHKISLKVLKQVEELPEHLQTHFESKMPVSKQIEILFEILKSGCNTEKAKTQMFNSSATQTEVLAGFQTSWSNTGSDMSNQEVKQETDISYAETEVGTEDRNIKDLELYSEDIPERNSVQLEKTNTNVPQDIWEKETVTNDTDDCDADDRVELPSNVLWVPAVKPEKTDENMNTDNTLDISFANTEMLDEDDRNISDFEPPCDKSSQEVADDFGGSTFILDKSNRAEVGNNLLPEIADDMLELENRPTEINNIEGREIPASLQKSDLYLGLRQCSVPLNNIMNHINFRLVESDIFADIDIDFINNGWQEAASTNEKHKGLKRIRNDLESLGEISVKKQKFGDEGVASCSYAMKQSRRHLKENKLKKMSEEADITRRKGLKISESRKCEACL